MIAHHALAPAVLLLLPALAPSTQAQSLLAELGGHSAFPLGDVDGDGVRDYATSEYHLSGRRVRAVSGASYQELYQIEGGHTFGEGPQGVAALGDVDGDGRDDLVVGDRTNSGGAWVHSGADGALLYRVAANVVAPHQFGIAVLGTEDLDGDGVPDFWVGANLANEDLLRSGMVRACSGIDGRTLYEVWGDSPFTFLGSALAELGDLDGDGVPELAAGGYGALSGHSQGRVAVHSGADGYLLYRIVSSAYDYFGVSIANAGDRDGDGLDDLLVGAPLFGEYGRIALYSGAGGSELFELTGTAALTVGFNVSGLGDFDLDGIADYAVGGAESAVLSGATLEVVATFLPAGGTLANPGDVDGDGRADVLVGTRIYRQGDCQTEPGCPAAPNSAGASGVELATTGTLTIEADAFGIALRGGPPGETGFLAWSPRSCSLPFGDGLRCIGFAPDSSAGFDSWPVGVVVTGAFTFDASGAAHVPVALPLGGPALTSSLGKPAHFQAFYRDAAGPGGSGLNASSSLIVSFCR